jgi:hypothetical protein
MQWSSFVVAFALAPTPGADDPAQLIRAGDYAGAAAAFERRYEQTGDPALLFGQAQALRRAGDCRAAIAVFERFVATDPPQADVDAANESIAACREILGAAEEPPDEPPPASPTPPREPTMPPPWYTDRAGAVLLGVGAVIAIVGAGLFGASYTRLDDRAPSEADYQSRRRAVHPMWGSGLGLLATGGALVMGGAIRWGVVARRRTTARVAVELGSTLTLRF